MGRGVERTWAIEVADIRPETWTHTSHLVNLGTVHPSHRVNLGRLNRLLSFGFLFYKTTNHIFLTGRACSLEIQYLGGLVNVGFQLENLFSFTISELQEA